ncbi:MAG: 30S ribosomal protein S16 [Candidatus Pacebacteria bacterium]|nr:30S ribosomal protein S16 [Candidatus Paceibacterota bacterium]
MLTIRLSRVGKKNKPTFRLIISEKARDPYGRALEILGSYNPHTKDLQAKKERILHWLSQGATMSASVNNLLIDKDIIKGEKESNSRLKTKKKLAKKAKTKEEKAKASEQAAQAEEKAKEEAKAEAPTEKQAETKTEENKEESAEETKKE